MTTYPSKKFIGASPVTVGYFNQFKGNPNAAVRYIIGLLIALSLTIAGLAKAQTSNELIVPIRVIQGFETTQYSQDKNAVGSLTAVRGYNFNKKTAENLQTKVDLARLLLLVPILLWLISLTLLVLFAFWEFLFSSFSRISFFPKQPSIPAKQTRLA